MQFWRWLTDGSGTETLPDDPIFTDSRNIQIMDAPASDEGMQFSVGDPNGTRRTVVVRSTWWSTLITSTSLSTVLSNYVTTTALGTALSGYVTSSSLSTALSGYSPTSHTHPDATTSVAGFMSAADKTKLDGLPIARSFAQPTRTLGTAFQISATRDAWVNYMVDISVSSLLLGSAQGTARLRRADDAAFTTNVVLLAAGTNSSSGVLNVVNIGTVALGAMIPAGKYVMIDHVVNTGTASGTLRTPANGGTQEVLM